MLITIINKKVVPIIQRFVSLAINKTIMFPTPITKAGNKFTLVIVFSLFLNYSRIAAGVR